MATRRLFLGAAALGVGGAALGLRFARSAEPRGCTWTEAEPALSYDQVAVAGAASMRKKFLGWLRTTGVSRDREVRNLVFNFYDPAKKQGSWIYPMLAGKAVLWLLHLGSVDEAVSIADQLLLWQQTDPKGALARSYGAFPSSIERNEHGAWTAGDRFYSGDNLTILEALVSLHQATGNRDYLNAAIGIGTWITETMCKGVEAGVWAEDHGAPMWYVTSNGDFSNRIVGQVEMLWIAGLHRLGKVTGERAYCRQADRAYAFYRQSQSALGPYMDHYDPGWPPVKYDAGRWRTYAGSQLISDNILRAALGACRMGDVEAARKAYTWLKHDHGAVHAYLDLESGTSGFPADADKVYYDVTSSGMLRSLAQRMGDKATAEQAQAFLLKCQDPSGGWYWGLVASDLSPVESQMAPMAGLWATADLARIPHG